MFGQSHAQVQIARRATANPRFATACKPQTLPIRHARRDAHLILFGLVHPSRPAAGRTHTTVPFAGATAIVAGHAVFDGNGPLRAFHSLLEGHHDVAFDVFPALRQVIANVAAAKAPCPAASRAKQLLEEVTEPGATEMKLLKTTRPATAIPARKTFPARRRTKFRSLFPIRTEFVVFFAFGRIAEHFVRLVDFLELLFRGFFVLRDIGMVLSRQLSECLLDIL